MIQVCLLGTTRIDTDSAPPVHEFGGVKPRQIIEILALAHNTPVSKESLADQLWEGRQPPSYAATIESHVSIARRHLCRAGLPRDVVRTVHSGYVLTDAADVDVCRLTQRLRSAHNFSDLQEVDAVSAQIAAAGDPLLASSPYAPWAIAAREELAHEIARACRSAARVALQHRRFDQAVELAQHAQRAEPLSEGTEQILIRALGAAGARSDALSSFADFRQRVHDELGVEPSAATHTEYLALLCHGAREEERSQESERSVLSRLLAQLPIRVPDHALA